LALFCFLLFFFFKTTLTKQHQQGTAGGAIHGTEHVTTNEDMELEEVQKKAKAKLNESDVGDVDWMANCFRMIMDAFDRDGLLLHEVSACEKVCVYEEWGG
jgi:hypothetical protein